MRIDWAMLLTIFMAIILADLFHDAILRGRGNHESSTQVTAETHSPAEPVVVYANPIDKFLAENHPNAHR